MRSLYRYTFAAIVPFAFLTISQAQIAAAAGAGVTAAAPHLVAALPAILTSAVSSGSAHVGQAVIAKLANPSVLSDGSKLAAGTQLLGHITEAVPVSKGSGKSSLGMVFDHFKTAGGQEMPLSLTKLQSIGSGKRSNPQQEASANASAQASGGSSGLLGGVTDAVGGTVNGVANGVTGLVGTVTSLPGVLLNSTGTLIAQGQNVSVPAGTRLSVAASASADTSSQ